MCVDFKRVAFEHEYYLKKMREKAQKTAEDVYTDFWFYCRWKGYDIIKDCRQAWEIYTEDEYAGCKRAKKLYTGTDELTQLYREVLLDYFKEMREEQCRGNL